MKCKFMKTLPIIIDSKWSFTLTTIDCCDLKCYQKQQVINQ